MTLPYLLRLLCLCLSSFFLLHLAAALAVSALCRLALSLTLRMPAAAGARLLLSLRLLPPVFALAVVAGICAPSYLWLEPETTGERVGPAFLGAALLGAAVCAAGLLRAARALVRSRRCLRHCPRLIESAAPVLMLAGVWRPRLVVSRGIVIALARDQLAVALRHERAHRLAHDNLKRLLLLAAPDMLPFVSGFRALDRAWARLVEYAADDRAVASSPRRSLALAAALVRVARMGSAVHSAPLATALLADGRDLAARVDRLLHPARRPDPRRSSWLPCLLLSIALAAFALRPATWQTAHRLLEALAR